MLGREVPPDYNGSPGAGARSPPMSPAARYNADGNDWRKARRTGSHAVHTPITPEHDNRSMNKPADPPASRNTEGDVNTSSRRAAWLRDHLDDDTRALLERDQRVFLHQSLSTPCLNVLDGAQGIYLVDHQGRQVMDFHGNSVHQVGFGHPRVIEAVKQQLDTLPFCPRRYTNETAVALAEKLCAVAPAGLDKCLLAPGGTSAIGMALKLVRYVTGRHKTLSMWDAFHGASLDAISVGGEALFRRGVGPLLTGAEHVPPPGFGASHFASRADAERFWAEYIDYVLEVQGDVGAVVAEPMRWTTVEPPSADFWQAVRASCDRHGALLVFDEIPSALGRSGHMFVCQAIGVTPDILVVGKGLGGAVFPLAAILVRADYDQVGDIALGHYTHEKSPVGCAAALATIGIVEDEGLMAHARTLGAASMKRMNGWRERFPVIEEVRGLGLHLGVELNDHHGSAEDAADEVLYRCLADGLSFKLGGGRVLTLCPPLTISEAQMDQALDIVEHAIAALG